MEKAIIPDSGTLPLNMMRNLTSRLSQLTTVFNDVFRATGGVGMSVGVLHQDEIIYASHFGQRSLVDAQAPDGDTAYYIASLTKAITAAGAAILVDRGSLNWEQPLTEYLPEFASRQDEVGTSANMIDVLSHRTGLTGANALWVQRKQEFIMPKNEVVKTASYIKAIHGFRSKFQYNNWGYGLATEVIERVTGQSYGNFITETIFEPLGLRRTTIGDPTGGNVVGAHMVYSNTSSCLVKSPPNSDDTGLAGAGGGKSTLNDLLHLYKSIMLRYQYEESHSDSSHNDSSSPFRQVSNLFDGKIGIGDAPASRTAYALGWVRSVLPERLGTIGVNAMIIGQQNMPLIGSSTPGTVVYHHHGNLVGAISSVHLLPETNTAIVVLCNTFGLADTADWIGQLILQTVIGEDPHDYMKLTRDTKAAGLKQFSDIESELMKGKRSEPPSQDLAAYCGRYLNAVENFELEISQLKNGTGLSMRVQRFDDVVYELLPYNRDIFYWPCNRDTELCEQMMFPWPWDGLHKITFGTTRDGSVESLSWQHDPLTEPEIFYRQNASRVEDESRDQYVIGGSCKIWTESKAFWSCALGR